MDINIQVCDVRPVVGQETQRYRVTAEDGREVELDLCAEHAEPLEKLLGVEVKRRPASRPPTPRVMRKEVTTRRRGRMRPQVLTLAEIEAKKAAQ